MSVLLLRFSGPLQSWGDSSRFVRRGTRQEPTKSGVVGMLASALGRSREDDLSDLTALEFGVRVDQSGSVLCDFQTERPSDGGKAMPLSYRYYLSDAKFLVALGGDEALLEELERAISAPVWPLFLGRRSCPPDEPVCLGLSEDYSGVRDALRRHPWIAADWYRDRSGRVELEALCDAGEGEAGFEQSDLPVSFGYACRRYASRRIVRFRVPIDSLPGAAPVGAASLQASGAILPGGHDPMGFI